MPDLYEILLRFKGGKLNGAHAQYLDGATIGDAIPLSLVAAGDKATLEQALGDAMTACLAAKEDAEERAKEAEEKAASVADLLDAKAEMEAKDANIQTLLAEVEALRAAEKG